MCEFIFSEVFDRQLRIIFKFLFEQLELVGLFNVDVFGREKDVKIDGIKNVE